MKVIRHPLPDHAEIAAGDLQFDDDLEVFMTLKDAVKCRGLDASRLWYVPVEVEFDGQGGDSLLELIESRIQRPETPS